MNQPIIIAIAGTSGIGKGYLKDYLTKSMKLSQPSVYTTRKRRTGETRPDRKFVSVKQFKAFQKSGKMIFVQDLYGDKYAFNIDAFKKGNIITEIHINIAEQFRKLFPSAILIGLTTNSTAFLKYRLNKRGDPVNEMKKRLIAAKSEIQKTQKLRKLFDINYSVDFENEGRIVQDIKKNIASLIKSRQTKIQLAITKRATRIKRVQKTSRIAKKRVRL